MTPPKPLPIHPQLAGALGAACLALDFVTEPETWPVFMAWANNSRRDDDPPLTEKSMDSLIVALGMLDRVFAEARGRETT